MRRLLLSGFVIFFLGLVPVASAATQVEPRDRAPFASVAAGGGGFSLADAVNWVRQIWRSATDAGLPPPGITNGSCVDPDGTSCHSH
ncbi:MAG TPA: hypothetical protein VGK45_09330 [Thermoanaerobaculia bacterium]